MQEQQDQAPEAGAEPPPEGTEQQQEQKPDPIAEFLQSIDLKDLYTRPEVQSEIERRATRHARSMTRPLEDRIAGMESHIDERLTQSTQRQADEAVLSWWQGQDAETRAKALADNPDMMHRVSDAQRRAQQTGQQTPQAAPADTAGIIQAWMRAGFYELRDAFPELKGMGDDEFGEFVESKRGATYGETVSNILGGVIDQRAGTKAKPEAEAKTREALAKLRATETSPDTTPASGGEGGSDYEALLNRLVAGEVLTPDERARFNELTAQRYGS